MGTFAPHRDEFKAEGALSRRQDSRIRTLAAKLAMVTALPSYERIRCWKIAHATPDLTAAHAWTVHRIAGLAGRIA